jgi:bifunctional DNA primase/polymerase-like protein
MTDMIPTRPSVLGTARTADEAAVWYATTLGWPVAPVEDPAEWRAPGPLQWAASSMPAIVRAVWRLSPGKPVVAALGRAVPGARQLGIVDMPALVGVAALERLGKNPAATGPITDGQGRIRFLVDLGDDEEPEYGLAKWRDVGVDVRVWGHGRYCPLPTPVAVGPSWVVWAIPPDPDRRTLPHARQVTALLDRAVRDAYPDLWDVMGR